MRSDKKAPPIKAWLRGIVASLVARPLVFDRFNRCQIAFQRCQKFLCARCISFTYSRVRQPLVYAIAVHTAVGASRRALGRFTSIFVYENRDRGRLGTGT